MFAKALLVGAFAVLATAQQSASSVLTFTRVPNPVTAGNPQAITFATNDTSSPVTILLRRGDANDLRNVSTLTSSATNGQYIWTPDRSLENGNDYALEIIQGNQVNYFGPFAIQGAGQESTSSASSATSASAGITPIANMTMASMTGTAVSAGTGSPISRNTTMSSATLTAPTTSGGVASSSNGAGFQATSSTARPSSTNAAAALATGGSAAVLLFGAIAAML